MVVTVTTPNILEGVTRRVEYLRALADPSRSEPTAPTFVLDVTDGLRSCVLLRDYLREASKLLWKDVIENELEEIDFAGRMYLFCLSITRKTLVAVRNRAEELKAARQDVSPEFSKCWPTSIRPQRTWRRWSRISRIAGPGWTRTSSSGPSPRSAKASDAAL